MNLMKNLENFYIFLLNFVDQPTKKMHLTKKRGKKFTPLLKNSISPTIRIGREI